MNLQIEMKKFLTLLLGITLVYSCTTSSDGNGNSTTSDSSTNVYTTIMIGTQYWSSKNLDVSTYSDGTIIPQVTDQTAWSNLTTGAWCYYNNDSSNGAIYGKLYNWYAVAGIWNESSKTDVTQRKKLAPTGYYIPSNNEWSILTNYLGGNAIAGGKMKEIGTTHWNGSNTDATNSSGFTGLPGGCRLPSNGVFISVRDAGFFWSSSEELYNGWHQFLTYYNGTTNRFLEHKKNGYSVRYLKD